MYLKIIKIGDVSSVDEYKDSDYAKLLTVDKKGFEWYPDDTVFDPNEGLSVDQAEGWAERSGRYLRSGKWFLKTPAYKQKYIDSIRDYANDIRQLVVGKKSNEQIMSESNKAIRAKRVVEGVGDDDDVAILQEEADLRGLGETPKQLAMKQCAKSVEFDTANAIIDGMEKKAIIALEGLTKKTDIDSLITDLLQEAELLKVKIGV